MPSEPASGRVRLGLNLAVLLALAVLVLSVIPVGFAGAASASSIPAPSAPAPSHLTAPHLAGNTPAASIRSLAAPSPAVPHPAAGTATGQFFTNTSGFAVAPFNLEGCTGFSFSTYVYNDCYPQSVDPTLMNLGNGNVGVSYQFATNASSIPCSGLTSQVHTRIGFSVSSNNGASFGSPVVVGDNTCKRLEAIEPSFAATGNTVYGAFVGENYTSTQPGYYTAPRGGDALEFVSSSNNGGSFSAAQILVSTGNISHPVLAASGQTIYIVYMNVSNGTGTVQVGGPFCYAAFGGCYNYPSSVWFIDSTNGGTTWSTPQLLPGKNASANDWSMNPTVAVNVTGGVAVAYFTNPRCGYSYSTYGCMDWVVDLEMFTSINNGTTWNGPFLVQSGVGISNGYFGYSFGYPVSQWAPQVQLIFDPTGQTVYFTWAGNYNESSAYVNIPYDYYCCSGVFFAAGSVSGSSFTVTPVYTSTSTTSFDDMFNPAIGLVGSTLYLTWTWNNESYCGSVGCGYLYGTLNQRAVTSTDQGATWTQPALVEADKSYSYCTSACATNQFEGYHSSVIASGSGTPLISYSLPENYQYTSAYIGGIYFFNYTYPTLLAVAQPFSGANVTLNVTSNNLAPGTTWKFELNGQTFSTTSKSLLITNVPKGGTIVINPDNLAAGYGTQISPASSVPSGVLTLNSNGTVFFNFSVSYQLILFIQPSITGYMDLTSSYNGTSYQIYGGFDCFFTCNWYRYWEEYGSSYVFSYVPIGWYFPTGTKIQFQQYQYETSYVNYWNGTGSHAYNGSGIFLNLTMDGPVNETGWVGGFGLYNETVQSLGLPSTSTYSFDFNGQPYSAAATKSVTVTDLTNGGYPITNVTATSTTAGWEYFGQPDVGSHVVVPDQPVVNLTFSYVDLASSEGTVSFHAVGLTNGTTWHFSFNGTEYSSSTPWINITTRSGTFPTSAYNVAAANGSVGYTPSGVPTSWSVTTGSTYSVTYVNAYRVIANAGIGGAISGVHGTLWYAAGSSASFHAAPNGAYAFGGWTGTGLGSYSGTDSYANISSVNGPITELASFFPLPQNRFNLTFTESGVPAGTWWTVYLSGRGYSTNQPALLVGGLYPCGPLGTYNLSIPYVYQNGSSLVRYAPGGYHATVCTTGATVVALSFSPQYYLSLGETAGGVAQAQVGGNVYSSSVWVANGTSVLLAAAVNPTYAFLGWNGSGAGSYTGPTESVGLVMLNPMSEIAAFAHPYVPLPPRFWVDFHLSSALAAGSAWTVTFGGTAYSSTSSDLNVTGLLSKPSYAVLVATTYSPDGLTKYTPLGAPTSLAVTHNQTIPLTYSVSYWLSIQASYGGVIAQPTSTSGWTVAGTVVTINATPNEGYVFIGWTGSGPLSYSGTDSVTTIHVTGPTTELAGFALAPPAAKVVTSSTWSAPTTWIGLAAVGLVIGLVVGLLVGRRGGGGPRPAVSDQPWSEGPSDTGGAPASEEPASPPGAEGGA